MDRFLCQKSDKPRHVIAPKTIGQFESFEDMNLCYGISFWL